MYNYFVPLPQLGANKLFNKYRMRDLRKKHGYTQESLAEVLRTTKGTVSNYENGHSSPDDEMIAKLADALKTTSDYLLNRTNDPSPIGIESGSDPELIELLEQIRQKGAEIEATAILRTASRMTKDQLRDILKVFEMISQDKKN